MLTKCVFAFAFATSVGAEDCVGEQCVLAADETNDTALGMLHLHARADPWAKVPAPVKALCDATSDGGVCCWNRQGTGFKCGANSHCCGDVCVVDGGACCQNDLGNDFPCGAGSTCCGNGCAAPGSKCCELATTGYKYPVTKDTACSKELSIVCHNRNGVEFLCGADSSCCGDVCSEPGGTCCKNTMGNNFVCAPGNFCCGNACASQDSKCCKDPNTGYEFPLLKSTPCPASLLQTSSNDWSKMKLSSLQPNFAPAAQMVSKLQGTRTCFNNQNNVFWCAAQDECCGNGCTSGPCCKNYEGYLFGCGKGSECCGNACMDAGSKCCVTPSTGYQYPVTADTECNHDQSIECQTREGAKYLCAAGNSCCGGTCVAPGGVCCENALGDNFPCGEGSQCCGNACAGAGSKCCTNKHGYKYPVTKATQCLA